MAQSSTSTRRAPPSRQRCRRERNPTRPPCRTERRSRAPKYTGVLAAADVFTESTTFWVLESIRLDLGYGSKVHP